MPKKTELLQVKMTLEQREEIGRAAEIRNQKVAEFCIEALHFYCSFTPGFLDQMGVTAEQMHLPLSTVIQNLLQVYTAQDHARYEICGLPSKAIRRAFQFDENGLVFGNRLSEIAFEQYKNDLEMVRNRLENAVNEGKLTKISDEEAVFLLDALQQKREEAERYATA